MNFEPTSRLQNPHGDTCLRVLASNQPSTGHLFSLSGKTPLMTVKTGSESYWFSCARQARSFGAVEGVGWGEMISYDYQSSSDWGF